VTHFSCFLQLAFNCLGTCAVIPNADNCYQLTADLKKQAGVVWSATRVDVSRSFTLDAAMYFGTHDGVNNRTNSGADGIAFVLQNQGPGAVGAIGGGMGWSGIFPSIGVAFDTYQNNATSGDPPGDYFSLIRDGKVINGRLTAPKELGFNIEDGQYHNFTFEWMSPIQTIRVSFDGSVVLTKSAINLTSYVGNKDSAYLGFTASTGEASNRQAVCIKSIEAHKSTTAPSAIVHSSPPSHSDAPLTTPPASHPIAGSPSHMPLVTPSVSIAPLNAPSVAPIISAPSNVPSISVVPSIRLSLPSNPTPNCDKNPTPHSKGTVEGDKGRRLVVEGCDDEGDDDDDAPPSSAGSPSHMPLVTPSVSIAPLNAPSVAPVISAPSNVPNISVVPSLPLSTPSSPTPNCDKTHTPHSKGTVDGDRGRRLDVEGCDEVEGDDGDTMMNAGAGGGDQPPDGAAEDSFLSVSVGTTSQTKTAMVAVIFLVVWFVF
jgi:Bacterial lectin